MKLKNSLHYEEKQKIYLKHKKLKIISSCLFYLFFQTISAQSNFVVAGDDVSSSTGALSYSVGQIFFDVTTSDGNFYTNQGLQVPYLPVIPTEYFKLKLDVFAYPNPTYNNLNLSIKDYQRQDLEYFLFSIDGKRIKQEKILNELTLIDMENLPVGVYFLHVVGSIIQANIKIIKQNL